MNLPGYANWTTPLTPAENEGRFFLAGRTYDFWPEGEAAPLVVSPGEGAIVLTMEDGSHIVQIPYRDIAAPLISDPHTFQTGFAGDSEDDCKHLERQRSLGAPVVFFPAMPLTETFQGPGNFTLLRAPAVGVVPGITLGTYPTQIYLNEVLTPGAATVTGRSVSASGSGVVAITYYPAYQVIIQAVQWRLQGLNDYVGTFSLMEILG